MKAEKPGLIYIYSKYLNGPLTVSRWNIIRWLIYMILYTPKDTITISSHRFITSTMNYDRMMNWLIYFIQLMCNSTAITFAWKSLPLKHAQMKTWMRDPSIISTACTVRWMWVLRNKKITPLFHPENPPISWVTQWVLATGFQSLQRGATHKHWFITGS